MNDFAFSLAPGTRLENIEHNYFLVSKSPVRSLRINRSLYSILQKHQAGIPISEIAGGDSGIGEGRLLQIFLFLTYRGYYRLDRLADLKDYPGVSIIIPVRNPSHDLFECLESIAAVDYPADRLEVIVVEDGPPTCKLKSATGNTIIKETAVTMYRQMLPGIREFKYLRLKESRGPGTARNIGAGQATGVILAFLDSDCMADKNWLRECLPFFKADNIGAVGGFVDGYYTKGFLDRYERVSSSLNLGKRLLIEDNTDSALYVPTCNMLVKRRVFQDTGGFKDGMRIGEDVDFCWRMRKLGCTLLYVPLGKVAHKHRNQLLKMLQRRMAYGSSEAVLYHAHRDKKKRFILPIWSALSFLTLAAAILLTHPLPLVLIPLFLGLDLCWKIRAVKNISQGLTLRALLASTLRSHFSFHYYTSFHIVRYYLLLLMGLGFIFHTVWFFGLFLLLFTAAVDYTVKKPGLVFPVYLFYYLLEHLAYQAGVFWGCLKLRDFKSYLPVFSRRLS